MSEIVLARRYAKAFVSVSEDIDEGLLRNDIEFLSGLFKRYPHIKKLLNSTIISYTKKEKLTDILTENLKHKQLWQSFFLLVINNHRFDLIDEIIQRIETYILAKNDMIKIKVKLAKEHSDEMLVKISKLLKKILKKNVLLETIIEPDLIGGFFAETESFQINASIKANLEKFKQIIAIK